MSAVTTDVWMDELSVNIPGASRPLLELSIKKTVEEFLRRSGAYSKALPNIALVAGRKTYTIPKAPEGPILFIHAIFYGAQPLSFADGMTWERLSSEEQGTPRVFRAYLDDPYRVSLYPTPSVADAEGIVPFVSLGYDSECQMSFPPVIKTHWYEAILSGSIYRLAAQPRKPYSNPDLAVLHGRLFRSAIAIARDQARSSFVKADETFYFPAWA